MVRGMDNSIIFQNAQNKARFPGRLGKSIVEEKEVEKVWGYEDKQDNALKHHRSFPNGDKLGSQGRITHGAALPPVTKERDSHSHEKRYFRKVTMLSTKTTFKNPAHGTASSIPRMPNT